MTFIDDPRSAGPPSAPAGSGFVPRPGGALARFDPDHQPEEPREPVAPVTVTPRPGGALARFDPYPDEADIGLVEPKAPQVSQGGTLLHSIERGVIPSLTGAPPAILGAITGAAAGVPLDPFTFGGASLLGGIIGGAIGGFGGSYVGDAAQEYGLGKLDPEVVKAIGQDAETRRAETEAYPKTAFFGGLLPNLLFARPGASVTKTLPEGASAVQKWLAKPLPGRLLGSTIFSSLEAGQEYATEGEIDPAKVAMAGAFGAIANKPTALGQKIEDVGTHAVRRAFGLPTGEVAPAAPPQPAPEAQPGAPAEPPAVAPPPQEAAPAPAPGAPDVHAVARTIAPDTFREYDELTARRATFRNWLENVPQGEPIRPDMAKVARDIRETESRLRELAPDVADAYAKAGEQMPAAEPAAPPPPPSREEYVAKAMDNLRGTSRTVAGTLDLSSTPGKAERMAEGLTAEGAAQSATQNFENVIRDLHARKDNLPATAEGMAPFIDDVARRVNEGIVKPEALDRVADTKFPNQTAAADLPAAKAQFAEELSRRLNDPHADPVETAAWIEWRANLMDHFWSDGVGKTSKALAAVPLMRAGLPLPTYPPNRAIFKFTEGVAPRDYSGPAWDKFSAYYHQMVDPKGSLRALLDRGAPLDELIQHPYVQHIDEQNKRAIPTGTPEDFVNPEWRAARTYDFNGEEVKGWDAAVDRLTDQARAYAGPEGVANERHAVIILGPPAAGKSSIANPIARKFRAAVVDADDAKLPIKEYRGGVGTAAVHEESGFLAKDVMLNIFAEGGNIVLPKVGDNAAKLGKMIANLKEEGYRVDLVHSAATPEISGRRNIKRMLDTGRLVPPEYVAQVGDKPHQSYHLNKGKADDFLDVDTSRDPARILEGSGPLADAIGNGRDVGRLRPAGAPGAQGPEEEGRQAQVAAPSFIAQDVTQKLIAAGRPQAEAESAGLIHQAYWETRAARFKGARGTAEEMYRREAPEIRGVAGAPVAPAAPTPADAALPPTLRAAPLPSSLPNNVRTFAPGDLLVDAKRFQFKDGGDEAGVTDRLKGVTKWDPVKAGMVLVWQDTQGRKFIVDGHQRLNLAMRIAKDDPAQKPELLARVMRESEGVTDVQARVAAAAKNIAEGTGTAVDAAKVLRDRPDLISDLPPRSELVRQARGLVNLSGDAFRMVVNDVVPPSQGAIVGRLVPSDPQMQAALIDLLAKTEPSNAVQAETIVRQGIEAGAAKKEKGAQASLFGEDDIAESLYLDRAKVLDKALAEIRRDKRVFSVLTKEQETIEASGNKLAADINQKRAAADAQALQVLQLLASRRGPVSEALGRAAERARADGKPGLAARGFVGEIRGLVESGDLARLADGVERGPAHVGVEDAAGVVERAPERGSPAAERRGDAEASGVIEEAKGGGLPSEQEVAQRVLFQGQQPTAHVVARTTEGGRPVILGVHSTREAALAHQDRLGRSAWEKDQRDNYIYEEGEEPEPYPGFDKYLEGQRNAHGEIAYPHEIPEIHEVPSTVPPGKEMHVVATGEYDPDMGGPTGKAEIHGVFATKVEAQAEAERVARRHWVEHGETEEFPAEWDELIKKAGFDPDTLGFTDDHRGRHWWTTEAGRPLGEGPRTPVQLPAALEAKLRDLEDQVVPYPGFKKAVQHWKDNDQESFIPAIKVVKPSESPINEADRESGDRVLFQRSLMREREAQGQMGMFGMDRASDRELAQRRANAPLRPSVEQKPMEEGLFGGGRTQKELFQIDAYHGSPHHFERFDASKIGTGEGAQAYGHGLYFAEHEGTAGDYRKKLSSPHNVDTGDLKRIVGDFPFETQHFQAIRNGAADTSVPPSEAAKRIQWRHPELRDANHTSGQGGPFHLALTRAIDYARQQGEGNLYKVNLKPDKEDLLDWDRPLNEQSAKVQEALRPLINKFEPGAGEGRLPKSVSAEQLYYAYSRELYKEQERKAPGTARDTHAAMSEALRAAGIPGIKYLDQGSRVSPSQLETMRSNLETMRRSAATATGDMKAYWEKEIPKAEQEYESAKNPTHNFVIFDDKDVEITHRNGEPVTKEDRAAAVKELYQRGEMAQQGDIKRGKIRLREAGPNTITLLRDANASTFLHETGHDWLDRMLRDAEDSDAPADLKADAQTTLKWLGVGNVDEVATRHHEQFARGFENYMMEGRAPSRGLAAVFAKFRDWLFKIYKTAANLKAPLNDEIRGVFDRLLAIDPEKVTIAPDIETGGRMAEDAKARADAELARIVGEHGAGRAADGAPPTAPAEGEGGPEAQTPQPPAQPGYNPVTKNPPPEAPTARFDSEKAGNIRLENVPMADIKDPQAFQDIIRQSAGRNNNFQEWRPPMSDAVALSLAEALAIDPAFLDRKQIGDAWTKPEIMAIELLLNRSGAAIKDAAAKATASGSAEDALAFEVEKARLIMMHDVVQGKASAARHMAGQTLQGYAALAKMSARMAGTDAGKLLQETGRTLFQSQREAKFVSKGLHTPQQVGKFTRDSAMQDFHDRIVFYYVNALISGPITHLRYSIGNAINALERPLIEIPLAAAYGRARETLGYERAADRVFLGEAGAQLYGIFKGSRDGMSAAVDAFTSGVSPPLPGERLMHDISFAQPSASSALGQAATTALSVPGRSVAGIHSFFKSVRYEQEIQGLAYRTATREGREGDAKSARIAELTTNPTPAMMDAATKTALRELYMAPTDYDSAMGSLVRFTNRNLLAKIVVPFMKIGSQIMRQAFTERTPLGALYDKEARANLTFQGGTQPELLGGGQGPGAAFDMQAAKITAGIGLMSATVLMAAEGMVTGDGPSDPDRRRVWLLNHRPNTMQVGNITIPFQGLGHLGMLTRFSADMYDVAHAIDADEDWSKVAAAFFHGLSDSVLDENFMRGVKDFLDAVYHPEEYGEAYIRQFFTNWLPFSVGLGQIARETDPFVRETHTIFEAAQAKVPGYREQLLPKRDMFGEPIGTGGLLTAGRGAAPTEAERYANDPVVKAMDALQIGIAPLPRKIAGIKLSDEQYDDFARVAGRMTKVVLDDLVAQPGFNVIPPGERIDLIHKIITTQRAGAANFIKAQYAQDIVTKALAAKAAKFAPEPVR